jgi:hypothetical protein
VAVVVVNLVAVVAQVDIELLLVLLELTVQRSLLSQRLLVFPTQ